jgi:AcrR family transcriptional regulator
MPAGDALPVAGAPAAERCDAARNRARILAAAERLIAKQGVDNTSLDEIAAEAGVGKGTLFRRFGGRAALMRALLSDREAELQEAVIRGAPPLGPGADARERLLALGPALMAFMATHGPMLRDADHSQRGSRFLSAPYVFWSTHIRHLVGEAAPDLDADVVADLLLAPLSADFVLYQLLERGIPLSRLADAWTGLVERLIP